MAYVNPKEPNWDKKARLNNPMLSTPITHSTGIDYSNLGSGSVGYTTTTTTGTEFFYNDSNYSLTYDGTIGWRYIKMEELSDIQQHFFDYLLKISSI